MNTYQRLVEIGHRIDELERAVRREQRLRAALGETRQSLPRSADEALARGEVAFRPPHAQPGVLYRTWPDSSVHID